MYVRYVTICFWIFSEKGSLVYFLDYLDSLSQLDAYYWMPENMLFRFSVASLVKHHTDFNYDYSLTD